MVGLEFKVKNGYNNFLYKIFNSINVQQYEWDIITDDIINSQSKVNDGIFTSSTVDGKSFLNAIMDKNYQMIFVDLKAFKSGSEHIEITNFKDFTESDCEIIFLCVDSIFIEFYAKDELILNTVYNNCIKFGFEFSNYISKEEASTKPLIAW